MITFAIGVAIGAAFSKFWIAVYNIVKAKVVSTPAGAKVVAQAQSAVDQVKSEVK